MNSKQDFVEQTLSEQDAKNDLETRVGSGQIILIALLVLMLFIGPTVLLKAMDPTGNWRILPPLVAMVALEGAWTTRWLGRSPRDLNRTFYRLAEAVSLSLLVTVIYWLTTNRQTLNNLVDNLRETPLLIFNIQVLTLIMLCILAWTWSNQLTAIFSKLVMSPDEIQYFTTPSSERMKRGIAPVVPVYRTHLYHDFVRHWAVGGLLLAFFAMLATIELSEGTLAAIQALDFRVVTRLGMPPELLLALIIYFCAGFWLSSYARLAVMQARWTAGGLQIDPSIKTKWRRQVLLIILLISALAAFLPIGSTLAISEIIQVLLGYLIGALAILLGLIPLLVDWLLSFLANDAPLEAEPLPLDNAPPLAPAAEASEPILQIPPAIIEGLVLVTIVVLALVTMVYFLKYRTISFDLTWAKDHWSIFITQVLGVWRRLLTDTSRLASTLRTNIEKVTSSGREDSQPRRLFPKRGQSPREKVHYYYLSFLYRAEKEGVSRAPAETPLEHEKKLNDRWPEAEIDIGEITRLFVEARYGRQRITDETTHEAKSLFQRLRKALRRRVAPNPSPGRSTSQSVDSL